MSKTDHEEHKAHMKSYWNRAKHKYSDFMDDVKRDPKFAGAVNLAKTHRKETFFIILMAVGILISFFHFLGGFLVGLVSTLCLPYDLMQVWKGISHFYNEKGQFKTVIIGLVGLYLLLQVPSVLIGAALGLSVNMFLKSDEGGPAREGMKKTTHDIESAFHDTDKHSDND